MSTALIIIIIIIIIIIKEMSTALKYVNWSNHCELVYRLHCELRTSLTSHITVNCDKPSITVNFAMVTDCGIPVPVAANCTCVKRRGRPASCHPTYLVPTPGGNTY